MKTRTNSTWQLGLSYYTGSMTREVAFRLTIVARYFKQNTVEQCYLAVEM